MRSSRATAIANCSSPAGAQRRRSARTIAFTGSTCTRGGSRPAENVGVETSLRRSSPRVCCASGAPAVGAESAAPCGGAGPSHAGAVCWPSWPRCAPGGRLRSRSPRRRARRRTPVPRRRWSPAGDRLPARSPPSAGTCWPWRRGDVIAIGPGRRLGDRALTGGCCPPGRGHADRPRRVLARRPEAAPRHCFGSGTQQSCCPPNLQEARGCSTGDRRLRPTRRPGAGVRRVVRCRGPSPRPTAGLSRESATRGSAPVRGDVRTGIVAGCSPRRRPGTGACWVTAVHAQRTPACAPLRAPSTWRASCSTMCATIAPPLGTSWERDVVLAVRVVARGAPEREAPPAGPGAFVRGSP